MSKATENQTNRQVPLYFTYQYPHTPPHFHSTSWHHVSSFQKLLSTVFIVVREKLVYNRLYWAFHWYTCMSIFFIILKLIERQEVVCVMCVTSIGGYGRTLVVSVYIPLSFLLYFHTITSRQWNVNLQIERPWRSLMTKAHIYNAILEMACKA